MRVHLPLLPLPILAAVVAFSACSKPKDAEPATRLIPPAIVAPPAVAAPAPPPAPAPRATPAEDPPSAEELAAFERPVPK